MNDNKSLGGELARIAFLLLVLYVLFGNPKGALIPPIMIPDLDTPTAPIPRTTDEVMKEALARGETIKTYRENHREDVLRGFPDIRNYLSDAEQAVVFAGNSHQDDVLARQLVLAAKHRKQHPVPPAWEDPGRLPPLSSPKDEFVRSVDDFARAVERAKRNRENRP